MSVPYISMYTPSGKRAYSVWTKHLKCNSCLQWQFLAMSKWTSHHWTFASIAGKNGEWNGYFTEIMVVSFYFWIWMGLWRHFKFKVISNNIKLKCTFNGPILTSYRKKNYSTAVTNFVTNLRRRCPVYIQRASKGGSVSNLYCLLLNKANLRNHQNVSILT